MKTNYFKFSAGLAGLVLFLLSYTYIPETVPEINSAKLIYNDCSGSGVLGGSCSASCPGCGCYCYAKFFGCDCFCDCSNTAIEPSEDQEFHFEIALASKDIWEKVQKALESSQNEVAHEIAQSMPDLYTFGLEGDKENYKKLASKLDAKIETLDEKTVLKVMTAIGG